MTRYFSASPRPAAHSLIATFLIAASTTFWASPSFAQVGARGLLETALKQEGTDATAQAALEHGDATRGAVLFYQSYLSCRKCHAIDAKSTFLGPNLTVPEEPLTMQHIVESILDPSKAIRKGFETITVETDDGKAVSGIVVQETDEHILLREATGEQTVKIRKDAIEQRRNSPNSLMPTGLTNQLSNRQQFLDLARYVWEISAKGPKQASLLTPPPGSYAVRPLPEYEQRIDHAGMLRDLNNDAFKRGQAIYQRLCINCHGDHDRPGSLPTSLRFATGKFKSGSDPFTMYQTLTRGFGMMQPQMWMVPQQKYDVIHYIREAYLKTANTSQYVDLGEPYLKSLPSGDTRGPEPRDVQDWVNMDYGPSLIHTYEVGKGGGNIAYKGIAIRLDEGPGGVSRGRYWALYDEDTLRLAAAWTGEGFVDWNGIMFNGRHGIHPRVQGDVHVENPTGEGWSPSGSFDAPRVIGRDGKPYGPVPKSWSHYKGLYHHGNQTILSYTVGDSQILESPAVRVTGDQPVFLRHFEIGPRRSPIVVQVATHPNKSAGVSRAQLDGQHDYATVGGSDKQTAQPAKTTKKSAVAAARFDGRTHLQVPNGDAFDMTSADFTITARITTKKGGTLFSKTANQARWTPNGKSLFVSGGRLVYDIGWVGSVRAKKRINDGKPHDVAMVWNHKEAQVRLFIDGKLEGQGELRPKAPVKGHVVRLGHTAVDFPRPASSFVGKINTISFFQRALTLDELSQQEPSKADVSFDLRSIAKTGVGSAQGKSQGKFAANIVRLAAKSNEPSAKIGNSSPLDVGVWPAVDGLKWSIENGALRATIPAGEETLRFTMWVRRRAEPGDEPQAAILGLALPKLGVDLASLTKGGPARWGQPLAVKAKLGADDGPLASDVLTRPADNPWLARVRPTGLDFEAGGDSMIVSAWDGDIWRVKGFLGGAGELTWKRIASGLFQPLGVKIVDGAIFITCRDQICILHDLNGDGEIDFYENFNNDHQVTEHFHEFAMGLQTDPEGNFYYAKSARHALKAVVPHHGTLLRVSKDGSKTEIVANGFRAANGVCINPDGTFIVTDQEGHWNPKNRINWVKPGGFYGNMFGYHDVTDSSNEAMEQPLCWITNSFDRSPSELLWVDSERWGPLNGSLLNFSYGFGKVYIVPHEELGSVIQGGMCELPLPAFPTGVMRGRFHQGDGHLYSCGMFAWAGNRQQAGGLYRIRATGKPIHLPLKIRARASRIELPFSESLDPASVTKENVQIKTWSLQRTANYGSKHYDEKPLAIDDIQLAPDGKSVIIRSSAIRPTWCMEIRFSFKGSDGSPAKGVIHNTIHKLGDD